MSKAFLLRYEHIMQRSKDRDGGYASHADAPICICTEHLCNQQCITEQEQPSDEGPNSNQSGDDGPSGTGLHTVSW